MWDWAGFYAFIRSPDHRPSSRTLQARTRIHWDPMRSRVAVLALGLLFLTVASPAIEVVAGCLEVCPDEGQGQDRCSSDACCSCCVHAGLLFVALPVPAVSLEHSGSANPAALPCAPSVRSSDILHVPKLPAA